MSTSLDYMSLDTGSGNESSPNTLTPEQTPGVTLTHQSLKRITTERPVPYPLHVAFAWHVAEELKGIPPPKGLGDTIGFWKWDTDRYNWGVSLMQLADGVSSLAYPDALVFNKLRQESIRFELVWPGYLHQPWLTTIPLRDGNDRQIQWTRKELGRFIALEYRRFAELCTRNDIHSKEPAWRVGAGGYTFEDMQIETFWNLTMDIWRAGVSVAVPSHGWSETLEEHYSLIGAEGCYRRIVPEGGDKRCPSCRKVHTPASGLDWQN